MEKHQQDNVLGLIDNLNAPHTPGADCAGCDPDFDITDDDTREIASGLRGMARTEGAI